MPVPFTPHIDMDAIGKCRFKLSGVREVLKFLIYIAIIFFPLHAFAKEEITGKSCYKYSDRESLFDSKRVALNMAKQNAIEGYSVFISSTTNVKNFELKSDIIKTVTRVLLKKVVIIDEKIDKISQEICYEIKATVEKSNLENIIEEKIGKGESIAELQSIIEDQNKEIELLRIKSHDTKVKKRFVKIIFDQKKLIERLSRSEKKQIPYTNKRYDENLAFINIESDPNDVDVYINEKWIGKTPIGLYEIESDKSHIITLRGDPRYFLKINQQHNFKKYQRSIIKYVLQRGRAKLILLSEYEIKSILMNGSPLEFYSGSAMIALPAGLNKFRVLDGFGTTEFEIDLWTDDTVRKDLKKIDYYTLGISVSNDTQTGNFSIKKFITKIDVSKVLVKFIVNCKNIFSGKYSIIYSDDNRKFLMKDFENFTCQSKGYSIEINDIIPFDRNLNIRNSKNIITKITIDPLSISEF